jgi:hypothetical protein
MSAPFVAVIMPLSGYDPGVPPRPTPPGLPGYPSQGLPVYPSQQPLPGFGGGYPSTQPLPPEGQPGSPSQPIAPVPAPEPGGPPAVYFVYEGKLYGPIYLPVATPKA